MTDILDLYLAEHSEQEVVRVFLAKREQRNAADLALRKERTKAKREAEQKKKEEAKDPVKVKSEVKSSDDKKPKTGAAKPSDVKVSSDAKAPSDVKASSDAKALSDAKAPSDKKKDKRPAGSQEGQSSHKKVKQENPKDPVDAECEVTHVTQEGGAVPKRKRQ